MNRFPSGTTQAPSTRKPNFLRRGRTPRVQPSTHSAILPSLIVYIRSWEIVFKRSLPWIRFDSHEESVAPQFAQNAAVDGLGKPHRGHAVVFAAGGTVASGENGEGAVAGGKATGGGAAPGWGNGKQHTDRAGAATSGR